MKKIIFSVFVFLFSFSCFCQENFTKRIFEFKVDSPLFLTNNSFRTLDYFKEEAVIDLTQIAKDMPDSGFELIAKYNPSFELSFNAGVAVSLLVGFDLYSKINLSKDIFDFLGNGSEDTIDIKEDINGFLDLFAHVDTSFGWDSDKFKLKLRASAFKSIVHVTTEGSTVTAFNDEDCNFGYKLEGRGKIYSLIPLSKDVFSEEFLKNTDNYLPALFGFEGFGIDAGFELGFDFGRYFHCDASVSIPIIPSLIHNMIPATCDSEYTTNLSTLLSKDDENSKNPPTFSYELGECQEEEYYINRPLKIYADMIFSPHNGIMDYKAGIGFTLLHPFTENPEELSFYFDYYLGTSFGAWNFLRITLSSERTDQIYIHKLQADVDIRLLRVGAGVSTSSSDFVSSFKCAGLGVFMNFAIGM